jgi:HPt (histidine-containing phosphotransfer) domain-containing protein
MTSIAEQSEFPIDWDFLRTLADGDTEFEHELLSLFVRDAWTHVAQLTTAVSSHDYSQVYAASHHLKGASSNVGAVGIQQISAMLEQQAQAQQIPPDAWELVEDLKNQLQEITDYVGA